MEAEFGLSSCRSASRKSTRAVLSPSEMLNLFPAHTNAERGPSSALVGTSTNESLLRGIGARASIRCADATRGDPDGVKHPG